MQNYSGASQGFNGRWTAITSIRANGGLIGWLLRCGCGHSTKYLLTHFADAHKAALTAREYHRCKA